MRHSSCIQLSIKPAEFHVFFQCGKYDHVRTRYLLNWYSAGQDIYCFYRLLKSENPQEIFQLAGYIYNLLSFKE